MADPCDDLRRLSKRLRSADHLPPVLREALAIACADAKPVRSVNQLARAAHINRRTLWHNWRGVVEPSELRLQDFLHWVLLLRAIKRKHAEDPWHTVARQLGIHVHTLSRYARGLSGRSLAGIERIHEAEIAEVFRERVLKLLFREEARWDMAAFSHAPSAPNPRRT